MNKYVLGIDLGGTKVEACLMDNKKNILLRERVPAEAVKGKEKVLANIMQLVENITKSKKIEAVGIGTPGTYSTDLDRLSGVPHTPVYEEPGFVSELKNNFPVPVIIENDANCLALAEYYNRLNKKYKFVMAVIIGTGLGSGLILGGRLYTGAAGAAGEIGHTTVKFDGRLCECGRNGCAEAYLSGPAISRRYEELSGLYITPDIIYQKYIENDPLAVRIINESCEIMAQVFANIINSFDLEAIILGGGVSNLPVWYEKLPELIQKNLFAPNIKNIKIYKASLGDSAGVVGAAYLALREIGIMKF